MLVTLGRIWSQGEFSMLQIVFVLLTYAVLIFVSLPVHELAHGLAAYKLGDSTAKWYGRLSLNPMKHLDPFGTLMLVICGFGYAKPVPVNPRYFRKPKRDMALTAFAGPLSNLLMAVAAVAVYRVVCLVCDVSFDGGYTYAPAQYIEFVSYAQLILIHIFASINLSLAVFNLLPIPPLDGSRIFAAVLPDKWVYMMDRYQQYVTIGLMMLLLLGALDVPLSLLRTAFGAVVCALFGMPNIF